MCRPQPCNVCVFLDAVLRRSLKVWVLITFVELYTHFQGHRRVNKITKVSFSSFECGLTEHLLFLSVYVDVFSPIGPKTHFEKASSFKTIFHRFFNWSVIRGFSVRSLYLGFPSPFIPFPWLFCLWYCVSSDVHLNMFFPKHPMRKGALEMLVIIIIIIIYIDRQRTLNHVCVLTQWKQSTIFHDIFINRYNDEVKKMVADNVHKKDPEGKPLRGRCRRRTNGHGQPCGPALG